MLKIVINMDHW